MNTTKLSLMNAVRAVIFTLACGIWVANAGAVEAIGKIQFVIGEVFAVSGGDSRQLKKSDPIFVADTIQTGAKASAQLLMMDEARIAVRPNSAFVIAEYSDDGDNSASVLSVIKGGFRTLSGKIGEQAKENYRVETPAGTIGLRGTDHAVFHIPAGDEAAYGGGQSGTYNKVYKGSTFLESEGSVIEITPNSEVGFATQGEPPQYVADIPETAEGPVVVAPTEESESESESEAAEETAAADESEESEAESETAESEEAAETETADESAEAEVAEADGSADGESDSADEIPDATADSGNEESGGEEVIEIAAAPAEESAGDESAPAAATPTAIPAPVEDQNDSPTAVEVAEQSAPVVSIVEVEAVTDSLQKEQEDIAEEIAVEQIPTTVAITLALDVAPTENVAVGFDLANAADYRIEGAECDAESCTAIFPQGQSEVEFIVVVPADGDAPNVQLRDGENYNIVGESIVFNPVNNLANFADFAPVAGLGEFSELALAANSLLEPSDWILDAQANYLTLPDLPSEEFINNQDFLRYSIGDLPDRNSDRTARLVFFRTGNDSPSRFINELSVLSFQYALELGDVPVLTDYDATIDFGGDVEYWRFAKVDDRVRLTHRETFFDVAGDVNQLDTEGLASFGVTDESVFSRFDVRQVEDADHRITGRFEIDK